MEKPISRPPVIVVLGHVDHGKTSLLDYIAKMRLTDEEFGGITQHIGAYEVTAKNGKKITFIDTPGHEAFLKMRQRGVQLADIALLVVAADASVKPQTIESYEAIKVSGIPMIVVINKIDLPEIHLNKIYKDLGKIGILLEGQGGETPFAEISAKTGQGIDNLLELISLVSEMQALEYLPTANITGGVVEVKKDKRGIVATIILKNGSLRVGGEVYLGPEKVKVRSLINDQGQVVSEVFPCTPVELLGLKSLIDPGMKIQGSLSEKNEGRVNSVKTTNQVTDFKTAFFANQQKKFNFLIKADTLGTLEVIKERFASFDEIKIIKYEVGDLTEADLEMAEITKASILLFNVKQSLELVKQAELLGINIFSYNVIYELLGEVENLIYSLREKEEKEARKTGEGKIIAEFRKADKRIAGIKVISGKIVLNNKGELIRGKKNLGEITIESLYQKADQVSSVSKGDECGAIFSTTIDFKVGDIVKLYV